MNLAPAASVAPTKVIVVDTFDMDVTVSTCGLPFCCPGKQPRFVKPDVVNPYLSETLAAKEEIDVLLEDLNGAFSETGLPVLPMVLGHLCLPFSPICVSHGFTKWRKKKIAQVIDDFNDKNKEEKGIFVEWNKDYKKYIKDPGTCIDTRACSSYHIYVLNSRPKHRWHFLLMAIFLMANKQLS